MDELFIYGGITLGSMIGAYLPVLLFGANPLGLASIACGVIGSFIGLWLDYKGLQSFNG